MTIPALLLLLVTGQTPPDSGYLTVRSNVPGIAVYLDGDYFGRTPVERQPAPVGSWLLSVASEDSLEALYDTVRAGGVSRKLSSVWTLTGIDAGTQRVTVERDAVSEVFVDYGAVLHAPTRAKWLACCGVGSVFGLGAVLGLVIGLLVAD